MTMAPVLTLLSLSAGPAHSRGTPKVIQYDSYDEGEVYEDDGYIWGDYFSETPGLGRFNCMAQVYSFEDADFPLVPTELQMLWAGEGAGDASEVSLKIYFYHYEGYAADSYTMAAGQYRLLDQELVLLADMSNEGTWVDLDLEMNGFDFDGDPDREGNQPITYGSIIANVCYENEQSSPAIAMDTDGYTVEPTSAGDEDIVSGHETSQFRSLIYWNGLWSDLHSYLLNTFGFADGGDLIMRLKVDVQWEPNEEDMSVDLLLQSVSPASQVFGDSEGMLITGVGIDANAEAFVGTFPLSDVVVRDATVTGDDGSTTPGRALSGYTSPNLNPGRYDITVRNPDGTAYILEDAYTVTREGGSDGDGWLGDGFSGSDNVSDDGWDDGDDSDDGKSGCGCVHANPSTLSSIWLLVPLVAYRRRGSQLQ